MTLPIIEDHGPWLGIRPAVMLIMWRANGYTTNANELKPSFHHVPSRGTVINIVWDGPLSNKGLARRARARRPFG